LAPNHFRSKILEQVMRKCYSLLIPVYQTTLMASVLSASKIFDLIIKLGYQINRAVEIGVYSFETSAIKPLIEAGIRCELYEAIPAYARGIKSEIKFFPNTTLFDMAVADYDGEMTMYLAGPSTLNAHQRESPAINHDNFDVKNADSVKVACRDFKGLDDGGYDYVSIDVEGGEYNILSRMNSRPSFINLETQSRDYINPKLGSITDWMWENGYKVWFPNDTDTLFIKGPRKSVGFFLDSKARWHNRKYFGGRL